MDSKMTPEYKVISEQVEKIIKGSNLPEVQKYSLLAGCSTNGESSSVLMSSVK